MSSGRGTTPPINRRRALGVLGGGALLGLLGQREARATTAKPWGEFPAWAASLALPPSLQPKQILEIHLIGGLSPWESLYAVDLPAYGKADGEMYWTFSSGPEGIPELLGKCMPQVSPQLQYFATDSLGVDVQFGPLVDALRQRPDILARLRLQVLSHNLFPHGPAQHVMATGTAPGVPSAVSTAAAFQRRGQELTPIATAPHAWVLSGTPEAVGLERVGGLGPQFAPILVRPGANFDFLGAAAAFNAAVDPATLALRQLSHLQAHNNLQWPGGPLVRSAAMDNVVGAIAAEPMMGSLPVLLPASSLQGVPGNACGSPFEADWTATRLAAATSLFAVGAGTTRYIALGETGFSEPSGAADGFDLHVQFAKRAVKLYPHVFSRICNAIAKPGAPSGGGLLSLDDTMVVLSTEFGRSPWIQSVTGRNHYPSAYVCGMFGGPIQAAQKGIVGAIDAFADPVNPLAPSDIRCAILYAAGIWPFEVGLFSYHDVTGAVSEADALVKLRTNVLGIPV